MIKEQVRVIFSAGLTIINIPLQFNVFCFD